MPKEEQPTRHFSDAQETSVAKLINGHRITNSGGGKFDKGDVVNSQASLLVECKTTTSAKDSFRIKKDWIEKNRLEAKHARYLNSCLAFSFGPGEKNYFVIDEKLMQFLVEQLIKEGV